MPFVGSVVFAEAVEGTLWELHILQALSKLMDLVPRGVKCCDGPLKNLIN